MKNKRWSVFSLFFPSIIFYLLISISYILNYLPARAASTVSTGALTNSTAYNNARKLVRDNSGNLYLAYYKQAPDQIFVAKSTDNGNTWANMGGAPIQTVTGYLQGYPSMAIDSQDNIRVVWRGFDAWNSFKKKFFADFVLKFNV